jgi:hypothetical protein
VVTSARWRARAISTSRCCVRPRVLAFALDLERELLGLEVLVADRDQRVLLDVVALLLAVLDLLGQARQALGVEGVARIEELHAGLVELRQRRASSSRPFFVRSRRPSRARASRRRRASRAVPPSSSRPRGAQRIDELAFEQFLELIGSIVRRPSVCAAAATESGSRPTRT